jgi:hypothetical protein
MLKEERKGPMMQKTFYLSKDLIRRAREASAYTGVPLSQMVSRGLERQLEKYQAVKALAEG